MSLTIEALRDAPVASRRVELVERKGIGHPDTIADSLVEAISLQLNRMYLERAGVIAHYNIDKALLVAGRCAKGFGRGELTRPMEFIVGDRATFEVGGARLPVEETVRAAVDDWVGAHLPHVRPGRDLVTQVALAPGSEQLRSIFAVRKGVIGSNDTSGASGYAPLSPTEQVVLATERFLNGPEFKRAFADTGQDVKVFGVRLDETLALTVAMPLLSLATESEPAYFRRKEEVLGALAERFRSAPFTIEWTLNRLDSPGRGADGVYLTLTGTSAEDADSGQVGRGNRVNGLIAFARPSTGEAAAGKNPVAHVGKIYSVLSHRMADLIYKRCPHLREVYVHLFARIGEPVDRPWASVQVVLADGTLLADVEGRIREVVEDEVGRMAAFRSELIRGEYPVC